MLPPIQFYFDFISPFGYLGATQIERVAAKHGRTVEWRPVLIGITVLKIMGLKPIPETPLKGPYAQHDAVRLAKLYDVPLRFHGLKGVNSVAGLRAFLWIKKRDPDLAKRFAERVFARLWVRGDDITAPEAVADEAAALGLNRDDVLAVLAEDGVKQALKDAVDEAVAKGVFGVPYFIADGEPFWGSDRLWMLEHWLTHRSWNPPAV